MYNHPHLTPSRRRSINQNLQMHNNFHRHSFHGGKMDSRLAQEPERERERIKGKRKTNLANHSKNVTYTTPRDVNSPRNVHFYPEISMQRNYPCNSDYSDDDCCCSEENMCACYRAINEDYLLKCKEYIDTVRKEQLRHKSKIKTKDKSRDENPKYYTQYLKVGPKNQERLQTLELEESFEEQERELSKKNIKTETHNIPLMSKKSLYALHTPNRRSTHNRRQTIGVGNFHSPKSTYRAIDHLDNFHRNTEEEGEDILEEIERLYTESQDENVQILNPNPKYSKKDRHQTLVSNLESEFVSSSRYNYEKEIEARIKDIESIVEVENDNLKKHNQYLLTVIKKFQGQDRKQKIELNHKNKEIKQLIQERNAFMERCMQLQNYIENGKKNERIEKYLQNSTATDLHESQHQDPKRAKLDNLRQFFSETIQQEPEPSPRPSKHPQNTPTPKFTSNRQSPELHRPLRSSEQFFEDESSEIVQMPKEQTLWTNANSGYSIVGKLNNYVPYSHNTENYEHEQIYPETDERYEDSGHGGKTGRLVPHERYHSQYKIQQELPKSLSESSIEEEKSSYKDENNEEIDMNRYTTEPPNTPLIHPSGSLQSLKEELSTLLPLYKESRDKTLRKKCVALVQRIKEIENQSDTENYPENSQQRQEKNIQNYKEIKRETNIQNNVQTNRENYKENNKKNTDNFPLKNKAQLHCHPNIQNKGPIKGDYGGPQGIYGYYLEEEGEEEEEEEDLGEEGFGENEGYQRRYDLRAENRAKGNYRIGRAESIENELEERRGYRGRSK